MDHPPYSHQGDLVYYTATSCRVEYLHSSRWALRRAWRSEICRLPPLSLSLNAAFSPADAWTDSCPSLRRPDTTFPDVGLPLKSRLVLLVWIKSCGEQTEPLLLSGCAPGKTISHQFRRRNVWFGCFKAHRAAGGNAQKIIYIIPDNCTCSKWVCLGAIIPTTSARCCQINKAEKVTIDFHLYN